MPHATQMEAVDASDSDAHEAHSSYSHVVLDPYGVINLKLQSTLKQQWALSWAHFGSRF